MGPYILKKVEGRELGAFMHPIAWSFTSEPGLVAVLWLLQLIREAPQRMGLAIGTYSTGQRIGIGEGE